MGAVLVGLVVGVLFADRSLAPWYPFLFVLVLFLSLPACYEFLQLLPSGYRPSGWLCCGSVACLLITNWVPYLFADTVREVDPWRCLAFVFTASVLLAFVIEMMSFKPVAQPGAGTVSVSDQDDEKPYAALARLGLTVLLVSYLGLLPSFLVQLRWPEFTPAEATARKATAALAMAIFVPKCCDIGAYFTGRFLGKHRMAPVLSPKKTWEGAFGGITASILGTYGIDGALGPVLPGGVWPALGCGATLGATAIIGDLAESFLKRACLRKDASAFMPGFGGVLDVVDSIIFSAPAAYWWLH
jgi:phosphatidate cytidylyltransferase